MICYKCGKFMEHDEKDYDYSKYCEINYYTCDCGMRATVREDSDVEWFNESEDNI